MLEMTPTDDPDGPGEYTREPQHGPEMDDTQVEATGELADQLEPVTEDDDLED
jgi:hypothetical protein